jgi:hypothetical protein
VAVLITIIGLASAYASPMTFCEVCAGYTISKRGNDVLIRCPGVKDPWMTFKDCANPVVKRSAANVTITCGGK